MGLWSWDTNVIKYVDESCQTKQPYEVRYTNSVLKYDYTYYYHCTNSFEKQQGQGQQWQLLKIDFKSVTLQTLCRLGILSEIIVIMDNLSKFHLQSLQLLVEENLQNKKFFVISPNTWYYYGATNKRKNEIWNAFSGTFKCKTSIKIHFSSRYATKWCQVLFRLNFLVRTISYISDVGRSFNIKQRKIYQNNVFGAM